MERVTSQVVLSGFSFQALNISREDNDIWNDILLLPVAFAAFSSIWLILRSIFLSTPVKNLCKRLFGSPEEELDEADEVSHQSHISALGGWQIFAFRILRLEGCLVLLGLSLATFIKNEGTEVGTEELWIKLANVSSYSKSDWLQLSMCITYAYASLLALLSIVAKPRLAGAATSHLVVLLLIVTGIYLYRDVWPLATYNKSPLDLGDGPFLWAKAVMLFITAVLVPLLVPRQYVPFDPKDPMAEPNPKQTTSFLSLITFTFMDQIIFSALKTPHLSAAQLPPLADYDRSQNLVKKSFKHLDLFSGAKKGHIFFGLITAFRREYAVMMITMIIKVFCDFANPFGINRLLNYLETNGENASVKPWVWIVCLFLGSSIGSLVSQWYLHILTVIIVRAEVILTQLIFEHALRIRMKAETSSSSTPSSPPTPAEPAPEREISGDTLIGRASEDDGSDGNSSDAGHGTSQASTSTAHVPSTSSGKQKVTDDGAKKEKGKDGEKKDATEPKADHLVGRINNLVTSDIGTITEGADFLAVVVQVPLQITVSIWFLYKVLGWSAFVGLATMILALPLPLFIANLLQKVQVKVMKRTDARVDAITETMSVLRMIKMFGWERKMNERIAEKREEELNWVWKRKVLGLLNSYANTLIPVFTMILTFIVYTVVMKETLSASKVFSSMTVFDMLRNQLHNVMWTVNQVIQGKVSLDRINTFLHDTELLDGYAVKDAATVDLLTLETESDDKIGFRDASFTWSAQTDGSVTPSRRVFTFRVDDELVFKRGCVNLIVGPTGSGKTSLLMALLGEMHYVPSGPGSWYNLPRAGGVAYAAQESWVQNETIRDNIVFGSPFDQVRYDKVIHQCGLERDLGLFDAGDRTEVGEKGLTLSGGQKARITLARAVYSSADILLLDDVLAALDVHTAQWIIEKCFRGDLLSERTVLLVTHNVAMATPVSRFVVSVGLDGRIASQGSVSEVLSQDKELAVEIAEDEKVLEKADQEIDRVNVEVKEGTSDGKLIVAEEVAEGRVSWASLKLFFSHMSGKYGIFFWLAFLGGIFLTELTQTVQTWFLGYWASQYDTHDPADVSVSYYMTVYALLLVFWAVAFFAAYFVYYLGSFRASKKVHQELLQSVLGTTLRWLDITPTSRIIARCTQDIRAVDGTIPDYSGYVAELSISMIVKLGAVVALSPIFSIPGVFIAVLGVLCGRIYMKAQLPVKREMSNARAPVLGHFGAAIAGLTSIRAYGAQNAFKDGSMVRINKYTIMARNFWDLNRWIAIRIDVLGSLFAAGLATYLVYGRKSVTASNTGFSLIIAIEFSTMILWWVRLLNSLEVSGNSLERIQGYINIEQEPKPTAGGTPPAYWPASGDLRVDGMSARYSPNGPKVLTDVSFEIKSGQRIGVVGRTGSGKSSLTLSLLRCIYTDGEVYYAGLPISSLNLDALRTNITIIPQIPELLSGTLRSNLDPFDQYDDATLNDALRAAGLFSLQSEMDEGRITLDTAISNAGGNLSVGQRQILALARAIVRGSKLLILDEATSAIDYQTDTVIQSSLRQELGRDVTVITVAHRLQTIMDADKIMVLDAGRIVEFDSPSVLLQNEKGLLRALVDESGDKDNLYGMASSRSKS